MEPQVTMRVKSILFGLPMMVVAIGAAGMATACAPHRTVYDSSYNDNHRWDRRERAAYERWEAEQHLRHIEYEQRAIAEQRAYWTWRHNHPDQDR